MKAGRAPAAWAVMAVAALMAPAAAVPAEPPPSRVAPSLPPSAAPAATGAPSLEQPRDLLGLARGSALQGDRLEARTEEVAALLRCPVCQGLSVADSPSAMAQNMKRQVRDLLAAGYDRDQVLAYFERSYGEFVRLQPPLRGINWLLWLAPAAALLVGGLAVRRLLRRPPAGESEADRVAPTDPAAAEASDPSLARYLDEVRALASEKQPEAAQGTRRSSVPEAP